MNLRMRRKQDDTYTEKTAEPIDRREPVVMRTPIKSMASRMVLTLIGAAAIIVGALLSWLRPLTQRGDSISYKAFATPSMLMQQHANFWSSVGFVMILCGGLAILGLALSSGWITRVAGSLGLIGSALFLISIHRAGDSILNTTGPGLWLALGGSVITVLGGLFSVRPMVVRGRHAISA